MTLQWSNQSAFASKSFPEPVLRALDTTEALFANFNAEGAFLTAQAIEVHGPVTEALLADALAHVEKRHPLLRAQIVPNADVLYWTERTKPLPRISIIDRISARGLEELTEIEVHRTYANSEEPLWRCTWIPISAAHHWIILAVHHAVADGISSMIIVRDLLETCSALLGMGTLPPELAAGPTLDDVLPTASRTALLRHRTKQISSRLFSSQPMLLPVEQNVPPERRRTGLIFGSLRGNLVRALQAAARDRGATISGVLAAALLESVRRTLGQLPVLQVSHAVSLRAGIIPLDQVGCFTTSIVAEHPLRPGLSFWQEAQTATKQLHHALERGDAAAALFATRGKVWLAAAHMRAAIADHRTAGRVTAISISNRGRTSSFSAGPFEVVAWYPATSHHTYGSGIQLSCATAGETFFFCLEHVMPLLGAATARRIRDCFTGCLERVVRNES